MSAHGLSNPFAEVTLVAELRTRVADLRQQLLKTTDAYHQAVAEHDAAQFSPLLRRRSLLTRQLLESQSELLLVIRMEHAQAA